MTDYYNKPWHSARFIPEIRLRDRRYSLEAWRSTRHSPRVLILNYLELKAGFLRRLAPVRRLLGENSIIILSCVGKDRLLDKLKMEDYCRAAEVLDAKAVISPDDYIYRIDYRFPTYQNHHFGRALERTETLIDEAKDRFSVIGLVVWANRYHIDLYVKRLKERGVEDFACACGDALRRGRKKETFADISSFMRQCGGNWKLLLGIDSRNILSKLRPSAFSSGAWSFYAAHDIIYRNSRRVKRVKIDPSGWQLALHNLEQNYKFGEEIGGT
jgi:hypothetical protein